MNNGSKLDAAAQTLEDMLARGERPVAFGSNDEISALAARFPDAAVITGDSGQDTTAAASFRSGDSPVTLMTWQARDFELEKATAVVYLTDPQSIPGSAAFEAARPQRVQRLRDVDLSGVQVLQVDQAGKSDLLPPPGGRTFPA